MDSIQCIAGSPLENYRHPFENVLFRQLQGKSEENGHVKKRREIYYKVRDNYMQVVTEV